MNLIIDKEEIRMNDEELNNRYIGEGTEGKVYSYKDEVLKIYNKYSNKDRLDEETAKVLKEIDTKRLLMPRRLIYNEDKKFIGYTMKYLNYYSLENLKRMKLTKFKNEIDLMNYDINILSKNSISIEDLNMNNIILESGIFLIDPGSYKIDNSNQRELYYDNKRLLNAFVIEDLIKFLGCLSKKQLLLLKEIYQNEELITDGFPSQNISVKNYLRKVLKDKKNM